MKSYKSVKNDSTATFVRADGDRVVLQLENGEEKAITLSTLKRWWRQVPETETAEQETIEEVATVDEETPIVETSEEVVETEAPYAQEIIAEFIPTEEVVEPAETVVEPEAVVENETPAPADEPKKKDDLILLAAGTIEALGLKVVADGNKNWITSDNGVKLMLITPRLIAVKEKTAKTAEVEYELKGYNHPFKAKVSLPETEDDIKNLIQKLLA